MRRDVQGAALGKWRSILPQLGVDAGYLTGRHGPCPVCRAGRDRFRFDDKQGRGTWICNQCGAGNGIDLVMKVNGWTFKEAAERVHALVGSAEMVMPKPEMTEQDRRTALRQLWRGSGPVRAGDTVARYLAGRGIELDLWPTSLRCCERCPVNVRRDVRDPKRLPAMLALVVGPDGQGASLHRTFLARDGSGKANMQNPRLLMPGPLPEGSCIRLSGVAPILGVAEGIETAIAASLLFRLPVWATINANLMAKWIAPEGVEDVAIFADNDANFHGQEAAYALAHRLTRLGLKATVNVPSVVGKDWNDVLLEAPPGVGRTRSAMTEETA